MEFDWIMGCGLGWFVGPQLLICDGLGWVGLGQSFAGLDWVGLKRLDPRTTLRSRSKHLKFRAPTGHRH